MTSAAVSRRGGGFNELLCSNGSLSWPSSMLSRKSWSAISRRRKRGTSNCFPVLPTLDRVEGLAEWKLADGGWTQVFQDTERAASSSVTFLVSALDDQLAELKTEGISIERTTTSDYVKTATVTDPAGNRVVFAEPAPQH